MDTKIIYEQIILDRCFSMLKSIRNGCDENSDRIFGLSTIIDIGGSDYRLYSHAMKACNSIILDMFPPLIMKLFKAYSIEATWYKYIRKDAHIFFIDDDTSWDDYVLQANESKVFAFSCSNSPYKNTLFIIKEYGITYRLPKSLIDGILEEQKLDSYGYISIVEDNAYSEVLNHNEDENDLTRGTGIISLKDFFSIFFGNDEYNTFKEYTQKLSKKVKDYFGFQIVKTLRPNTLNNYRNALRNDLYNYDLYSSIDINRIIIEQKTILDNNFRKQRKCELMTGNSDFAQSYMTSEWLFSSLTEAGYVDYSAIVMGYFKSIEQFLFSFIRLHTIEEDNIPRKIYLKGSLINLTNELMDNEDIAKDLTLGSLTGFFGHFDEKKSNYQKRNVDLLMHEISENTYQFFIDTLEQISSLRNGFLHRHNLTDWEIVKNVRNNVRIAFYLLLGSYKFSDSDIISLGMIQSVEHDEYYKTCEYMHKKAYDLGPSNNGTEIPIMYLNGKNNPYQYWTVHSDDYIEYNEYGEPIYSGIYLEVLSENKHSVFRRNTFPSEIWEGYLKISYDTSINTVPSGPIKKIYANGLFFGDK